MRLPPASNDVGYSFVREHDLREWWDPSIQPSAALGYQQRIALLLGEVRRWVPTEARLLDVGCAQGTVGLLLGELGYHVTLLDVREAHIRYARARYERGPVEFSVGRVSEVPLQPSFDAVICTELLEHVHAPANLLTDIVARLRPNGLLFVTTPNADYSASRLPSYGGAEQGVIDTTERDSCDGDAHRYLFSLEELSTLLRSVGLRIEQASFSMPFWTQGHLKTRFAIDLWYKYMKRLPELRSPRLFRGALARRISSCLFARARMVA